MKLVLRVAFKEGDITNNFSKLVKTFYPRWFVDIEDTFMSFRIKFGTLEIIVKNKGDAAEDF